MNLHHAAALALVGRYLIKAISIAGLLLILVNPTASFAGDAAEDPIPAGQWAMITPPMKVDSEIGRAVVVDNAPESEWTVFRTPRDVHTKEVCERFIAYTAQRARDTYLDDPNRANLMTLRAIEQARCLVSDGSSRFKPPAK